MGGEHDETLDEIGKEMEISAVHNQKQKFQ